MAGRDRRARRYRRQYGRACSARAASCDRHGLTIAREEMDIRYFGLMRLAQAFGPILRARGADGVNAAAAFVNLLSVHALMNWPAVWGYLGGRSGLPFGGAMRCGRSCGRAGSRCMNVFFGPLETEWFQTVPPPKVAPAALARAVVRGAAARASRMCSSAMSRRTSGRGWRSIRRRVERELAGLRRSTMTVDVAAFARAIAAGRSAVIDLTHTLSPEFPTIVHAAGARPVRAVPDGGDIALRRARARPGTGTILSWASIPGRISMRRSIGSPARICRTTPSTRSRPAQFIAPGLRHRLLGGMPPPTPISC